MSLAEQGSGGVLQLPESNISDEEVHALAALLRNNTTIEELNLRGTLTPPPPPVPLPPPAYNNPHYLFYILVCTPCIYNFSLTYAIISTLVPILTHSRQQHHGRRGSGTGGGAGWTIVAAPGGPAGQ